MSSLSSSSKIMISPALPEDLYPIAKLECLTFWDEEFSSVAFGPHRGDEANHQKRVERLAAADDVEKGLRSRVVKAVGEDGEILGMAHWSFDAQVKGVKSDEEKSKEGEKKKEEKDGHVWGKGANVKLCEDAFIKGDEHMLRSCKGKAFAKLGALVVHPKCQRMGIGTKLLEDGLREVDEANLQCVLAASRKGLGLYKKHGFVVYEVMKLKLWEYEGGEGMGEDDHVIMYRPAQSKEIIG